MKIKPLSISIFLGLILLCTIIFINTQYGRTLVFFGGDVSKRQFYDKITYTNKIANESFKNKVQDAIRDLDFIAEAKFLNQQEKKVNLKILDGTAAALGEEKYIEHKTLVVIRTFKVTRLYKGDIQSHSVEIISKDRLRKYVTDQKYLIWGFSRDNKIFDWAPYKNLNFTNTSRSRWVEEVRKHFEKH